MVDNVIGERLDGEPCRRASPLLWALCACLILARKKTAGEPRGGLSSSRLHEPACSSGDRTRRRLDAGDRRSSWIPIAVDRGWEAQGFPAVFWNGNLQENLSSYRVDRVIRLGIWSLPYLRLSRPMGRWRFRRRALNSPATFSLCCRPATRFRSRSASETPRPTGTTKTCLFAVPHPLSSGLTTPPKLVEIKGDATNLRCARRRPL